MAVYLYPDAIIEKMVKRARERKLPPKPKPPDVETNKVKRRTYSRRSRKPVSLPQLKCLSKPMDDDNA